MIDNVPILLNFAETGNRSLKFGENWKKLKKMQNTQAGFEPAINWLVRPRLTLSYSDFILKTKNMFPIFGFMMQFC